MADLKNLMREELRKSSLIQTSSIDETEELLDTGLEKNEDNILAAALAYLDNKGYRRRADNIDFAKNMIMESSEGYDTVIVKQKRVVETDLFEDAGREELQDAMNVCKLETLTAIHTKLERMANRQYEYAVEFVDEIQLEADRPKGKLGDYVSIENILNDYGSKGWELDRMYGEPKGKGVLRTYLIFKREKMD
ncbi:MAG: hypothetical protein IKP92_02835 [Lachnospiraceae bacterium]|nr:hypothetical protein [Lachnospiraceae bacterium]